MADDHDVEDFNKEEEDLEDVAAKETAVANGATGNGNAVVVSHVGVEQQVLHLRMALLMLHLHHHTKE